MKRTAILLIVLVFLLQPACFRRKPPEERVFDARGTVMSVGADRIVIETPRGEQRTFEFTDASIKGGDFDEGAEVRVYYKKRGEVDEVTMVVRRVSRRR